MVGLVIISTQKSSDLITREENAKVMEVGDGEAESAGPWRGL